MKPPETINTFDVSVIIPTYNRAVMLCNAIESVLQQTLLPKEIIIVDDGSTDNTSLEIQKFASSIKYFRKEHKGVSAARNFGIINSSGKFIAFLDSDDLWLPEKLANQVEILNNFKEFPITYTDEIWLRNGKRVNAGLRHKKVSGWIFEPSLHLCLVSPSSVLIRRELFNQIGYFDETLTVCEDYDLWLRIAHRYPFHLLNKPLIIKRGGHKDQLSEKYWGMDRYRVRVLDKLLTFPDLSPQQRKEINRVLHEKKMILYQGLKKRGKKFEAQIYEPI